LLFLLQVISFAGSGAIKPQQNELADLAVEVNKTLPRMADESTELTSVEARENTFVYNHTMPEYAVEDLDLEAFGEAMRVQVVAHVCSTPQIRELFLDKGIQVKYAYVDRNGTEIAVIDVDRSHCDQ